MSMMVFFVLSFFSRDVLDEILNLIESVFEGCPTYSYYINLKEFLQEHKLHTKRETRVILRSFGFSSGDSAMIW